MKPALHLGLAAFTALTLGALPAAQAQVPPSPGLPFGTLSFVTPSGTAAPDERIEVRVRLTLDTASAPLTFTSNPLTGFAAADLPTQGNYYNPATQAYEPRPFASVDAAFLNTFYGCSGTFTDVCGPSASYAFNFWLNSTPGSPSVNFVDSFTLAPGAGYEYLFGTFDPVPGGAAPGTYTFFNTGLTLSFSGVDADGNFLESDSVTLAQSCPTQDLACAFTRVVEVPEPGSYAMMAVGLLGLGLVMRRRRAGSAG